MEPSQRSVQSEFSTGSVRSEESLIDFDKLIIDFSDRGPLEISNKLEIETFWTYIGTHLVPLMELNENSLVEEKPQNQENNSTNSETWVNKLEKLKSLGLEKIAKVVPEKGCRSLKSKKQEYKIKTFTNVDDCRVLRKWDKDWQQKHPDGTNISYK